jgi:O-antigen ligase
MRVFMDNKIDLKTQVLIILFYLAVITVSFDIFLVFNIGGFNVRITQVLLIVPVALGVVFPFFRGKIIKPIGFYSLLLWTALIVLYIPNTTFLTRNIGYAFWLIFNVVLIFSTVNLFNSYLKVVRFFKLYYYSFFLIAIFGLLQFILPFLNIKPILVQQWWTDQLPRINGFSYEPSYFATYMLIGWVMSAYLLLNPVSFIPKKWIILIFGIETLVMLLSSSRMGWLMMILWFMQYPIKILIRLWIGKVYKSHFKIVLTISGLTAAAAYYTYKTIGFEPLKVVFYGLGLFGTASHSSGSRLSLLADTLTIFMKSPLIGYSLGGIPSAIGRLSGIEVVDQLVAKEFEGINIIAEVLAASGIIGFIPFVIYFMVLILNPVALGKRRLGIQPDIRSMLLSSVYSLIFLLLILQFNQNILRPYLWLHISILSSVYYVAKTRVVRQIEEG